MLTRGKRRNVDIETHDRVQIHERYDSDSSNERRDCKLQPEKAPHSLLPSDANINAALCTRATPHINGIAVLAITASITSSGFISRAITSCGQSQGGSEI
jgi:hypothetical protein